MIIHLVQIVDTSTPELVRRVALVQEPNLHCLVGVRSVYELAQDCIRRSAPFTDRVHALATGEIISYEDVYTGASCRRLLAPIDVPDQPWRTLVSGTGLTHIGSAQERQAMHLAKQRDQAEAMTDSMRMFQWGVEAGRPQQGQIGVAPEWFYKGDGSSLRAPFDPIEIPGHAEDGGEEAELAGIYVIDDAGTPYRLGIAIGNEFSDHKFEKRNYLNLAGSKLRACSLGPELVVGADFDDVRGHVRIERTGAVLWQREIWSGEQSMCHSLANLEHHHFKFAGHRQAGSVHVHFYGANALSFGDGVVLREGDVMEVRFDGFGRALRNPVRQETSLLEPFRVQTLE